MADSFKNFLATAVVPGDCKEAVICPIFRKGDTELLSSELDLSCV